MRKYKIIINGCGGIANFWLQTINEVNNDEPGKIEIMAACDPNPEMFKKFESFGLKNIPTFSDLTLAYKEIDSDITLILTPPQFHTRYTKEAVMNNNHVISEKPIFCDYNDLRNVKEIMELADEKDILLVANQQYRWMPRVQAIKKALDEKLIGNVEFIVSQFSQNRYHFNGWWRSQHHDMSQLNWFIHHYDTMRYLLGKNPSIVRAKLFRPSWSKIYGESSIFLNVTFEDGIEWQYNATQEGIAAYSDSGHTTFTMYGNKGTIQNTKDDSPHAFIEVNNSDNPKVVDLGGKIENENQMKYPPGWKTTLLKTFEAIENGKKHETSYEDNLWTMGIVLCARESSNRGGIPIDVKEYMDL